jgi:hypothetical protein
LIAGTPSGAGNGCARKAWSDLLVLRDQNAFDGRSLPEIIGRLNPAVVRLVGYFAGGMETLHPTGPMAADETAEASLRKRECRKRPRPR